MAPNQLAGEEEDEEAEGFIEYNGIYYDDGEEEPHRGMPNYVGKKKISISASAPSRLSKLPTLQPAKPQFVSISLPSSKSATPRGGTFHTRFGRAASNNKRWPPPVAGPRYLLRQPSSLFVPIADAGGVDLADLHRSKSCGDGRSSLPPDEFDICTEQPSPITTQRGGVNAPTSTNNKKNKKKKVRLMMNKKKKNKMMMMKEINNTPKSKGGGGGARDYAAVQEEVEEETLFKCTPLCMYLARRGRPASDKKKGGRRQEGGQDFSQAISLEKFECGSWASPRSVEGEKVDTQTPVNAAFLVFESDDDKVGPTSPHVRFSTAGTRDQNQPGATKHPSSPT